MQQETVRRRFLDPDGRIVTLTEEAWAHILEHEELQRYEHLISQTVSFPDDRSDDPRPDRQRFYSDGVGPTRYFCVVVEYVGEAGDVVTAFGHRNAR